MGKKSENTQVATYNDAKLAISQAFRVTDDMGVDEVSDLIYATSMLSDKMNGYAMLAVGLIEKKKLFEGSDFNTTAKFCSDKFGFSSGTVSNYLKTFRKFAVCDDGVYTIREGFEEFSASALSEMARYDSTTIDDLLSENTITASTTVSKIRELCKKYENDEILADGSEIERIDAEEVDENDDNDKTTKVSEDGEVIIKKNESGSNDNPVVRCESFIGQIVVLYKKLALQLGDMELAYKTISEVPERVKKMTLKDCK